MRCSKIQVLQHARIFAKAADRRRNLSTSMCTVIRYVQEQLTKRRGEFLFTVQLRRC